MARILTIDDNVINIQLIVEILKKQSKSIKVSTASSGREGIDIAKKEIPDLILLDILMPDLDGFEVCQILKNDKVTQYIPIIMVSALGNTTHNRIKSLDVGADAIIAKPFNHKELISQINVMLRIKSGEDTLRRQNEIQSSMLKEQAKEFEENEGRYTEISEYTLEFFWEINKDGFFTFISPVIETILGYSSNEIVEKVKFIDLIFENKKISTNKKLNNIFLKREYFRDLEIKILNKDSKAVWLKNNGFPIFDDSKKFLGFRGVSSDITRIKKTEMDLKKSLVKINTYQNKLKLLNSRLSQIEEAERRKIAEYLHDSIGQTLSLSQINLSSIQQKKLDPTVKEIINNTITLIDDSIDKTRSLTYDLSPPILNELGLIPAINWKLDNINKEYNIDTIFHGESCDFNFKLEIRTLIFRIISELLINIIKHAKATEIKIIIEKENNHCKFSIIDNGIGFSFNPNKIHEKSGFGLFSVIERVESLSGKVIIKSKVNYGTKVLISLPKLSLL